MASPFAAFYPSPLKSDKPSQEGIFEEVLDLTAYIAAGANPHSPLFQGGHEHGHGH